MDTSSVSSRNATVAPTKYQRRAPVPAAAATTATMRMVAEHEAPITVRSSTSSGGANSVVSSAERNRRVAFTSARRETARLQLALAVTDEQLAADEMEEALAASTSGSQAILDDVASNGGESARAARPRSNAELAVPPLLLGSLQEHQQQHAPRYQEGERSPANAGSVGQGTTNILIQQAINNDGCVLGPFNVNMHQEVHHAAEQVAQVAEARHQAVAS